MVTYGGGFGSGWPVLRISSFPKPLLCGESQAPKGCQKSKRTWAGLWEWGREVPESKGLPTFCSIGVSQMGFSGRMEALMLSSVLDVLLHRTLVNPSVQHLWVLHSFPTERARTAY